VRDPEQAELQALRARYESLRQREREVLALVVSGLQNKQIGGEPGVSEITVKAHRGKMIGKPPHTVLRIHGSRTGPSRFERI
jgi:FixJ family two-component response regulator